MLVPLRVLGANVVLCAFGVAEAVALAVGLDDVDAVGETVE